METLYINIGILVVNAAFTFGTYQMAKNFAEAFKKMFDTMMEENTKNFTTFKQGAEGYMDSNRTHFERIHKQYVDHATAMVAQVESMLQKDDLKN